MQLPCTLNKAVGSLCTRPRLVFRLACTYPPNLTNGCSQLTTLHAHANAWYWEQLTPTQSKHDYTTTIKMNIISHGDHMHTLRQSGIVPSVYKLVASKDAILLTFWNVSCKWQVLLHTCMKHKYTQHIQWRWWGSFIRFMWHWRNAIYHAHWLMIINHAQPCIRSNKPWHSQVLELLLVVILWNKHVWNGSTSYECTPFSLWR
jgi:hypothetical protein